jgi:hypothetical protein
MKSRKLAGLLACATMLSSAVASAGQARAASPSRGGTSPRPIGQPYFTVLPAPRDLAGAAAKGTVSGSVPNWTGQFSLNGVSYPYTMVGTNPALGSATTTVPVTIVPLRLTFSSGQSLDGTQKVSEVKNSPLFLDATYASGTTQYGDAMQRAQFWNKVQTVSPGYHLRLAPPSVLPTRTLTVPAASGHVSSTPRGEVGFVDFGWVFSQFSQLTAYYSPSSFLIILVKDVYITQSGTCCIIGFHFAFEPSPGEPPATFTWSAYIAAAEFGSPIVHDVYALSHEVAEWMSDPFVNNTVPQWVQPGTGQCFSNLLEVGDPVEALPEPGFSVVTNNHNYHLTDVAGLSWFAHRVPSRELGGAYSYLGLLPTYSTLC